MQNIKDYPFSIYIYPGADANYISLVVKEYKMDVMFGSGSAQDGYVYHTKSKQHQKDLIQYLKEQNVKCKQYKS